MRNRFKQQLQLGLSSISELQINTECRDEIVPILVALQHIFSQAQLRSKIIALVEADVNKSSSKKLGREGLDYWQIVVLAAVRLGCNLDYDKLQDLSENHRSLRCLLQVGDLDDTSFGWRRIQDTLCQLSPDTLAKINQVIVSYGQVLHGDARSQVRVDSFVIESNIHFPTDSSLIWDGIRVLLKLCADLASDIDDSSWRQTEHHKRYVKKWARNIARISSSKSPKAKEGLPSAYTKLIDRAGLLLERAKNLVKQTGKGLLWQGRVKLIQTWIELTEKVTDNAYRRVILGEQVPNDQKLFSLFETHTQLYQRGKAGKPVQFGRQLLIFEDKAGFISHYLFMGRHDVDSSVIVAETSKVQKLHSGEIKRASFDRGFYSEENLEKLSKIIDEPCLPPRHPKLFAEAMKNESISFHECRQRHPGVESAIGALQRGNGLKRCRDHSEIGHERYCALGILGRNIHTLGKLLLLAQKAESEAAKTRRKAC